MTRTAPYIAGNVICIVLAVADAVGVLGIDMEGAPPAAVVILGGVFGLLTLAGAVPSWRGDRTGRTTVIVSRVLSGLLAIPAFFVDAPAWARLIAAASLLLTVVGVGLLTAGARQRVLVR